MRILVTGAASHLAQVLLPRLCARDDVSQVIGLDVRPARFAHSKFQPRLADIRTASLHPWLENCDALIHLAFVVLRGRMPAQSMASVNLDGTCRVFAAARDAGVARLVHLSSAAVYGSGENLTEAAPLAPLPGFLYAAHKAALEAWFAAELPQAVRLRPHVILGPHCQPLFRRLLRLPFRLRLPEPAPRLQCVHEEDVVSAIEAAIEREVSGPFNLAGEESFTLADILQGRWTLSLPLARRLLDAAWRLTGFGGEPAWLAGAGRPLTLDCARARKLLGWRPRFDLATTLAASGAAIMRP